MFQEDGLTKIEEEDQCYTCEYFTKGVMCPLLEALAVGVARLEGDVVVKNCGFYVEFKRYLELVDTQTQADTQSEPQSDNPASQESPPAANLLGFRASRRGKT